jgi:hypothetical protein
MSPSGASSSSQARHSAKCYNRNFLFEILKYSHSKHQRMHTAAYSFNSIHGILFSTSRSHAFQACVSPYDMSDSKIIQDKLNTKEHRASPHDDIPLLLCRSVLQPDCHLVILDRHFVSLWRPFCLHGCLCAPVTWNSTSGFMIASTDW